MKNQYPALLLLFLFISIKTSAQICSGTINTVWQDDFGSGTPQLSVQTSLNITSGYTYEEFGVHEGHYSLVNKFDYFGFWHFVPEDHTPNDSGGYFLVIDGNNSVPLFYETIVRNICPFRQYSFSTYAMNIDLPEFPSNQTFTFIISDTLGNQLATWNSPPISVTDIPQWVQLGFSFTSGNNTALKLQARFNQTGYDDFAFDDFQFSVCGPTLGITTPVTNNTCVDSIPLFSDLGSGYASPVYQWKKKNASGIFEVIQGATNPNYTDHSPVDTNVYLLVVGDGSLSCPIIETKELIVSGLKNSSISAVVCAGTSYEGYTNPGVYTDRFNSTNGCDSIRTLTLTNKPKPVITKTNDSLVCGNTSVSLYATGGIAYVWTPGNSLNDPNIPNPVATPSGNTVYHVKVTNADNCTNNDSVSITVKRPPTFTVTPDTSTCSGSNPVLLAGGGSYYLWSPASQVSNPNISNPVATATVTTLYSVKIKDNTCNDSTVLLTTITVLPLPVVSASKSNDISCSGGSSTLTATGALNYSWVPSAGLTDPSGASTAASPTTTTLYTVHGFDATGCSNSDSITVLVDFTGKATYYLPNAFTPNGDGLNDCYGIKYAGLVQQIELIIYNRFGEKVFITNTADPCWDGRYKGKPAAAGNYVYYLKAITACGTVEKKGNLLLIR
jgi:gliding motility-associated-like protein